MSLLDYISPGIWKTEGKCSDLPARKDEESEALLESFFADEEEDRKEALAHCQDCPIRLQCLREAMETGELFGVWGGVDESERRRNLWVSPTGKVGVRKTRPRCPSCQGTLSLLGGDQVECDACMFGWESQSTAEGLRTIPKPIRKVR